MRTTNELRTEAAKLEKDLVSGKIKGLKAIKRAKKRVSDLRFHANRRDKTAAKKQSAKTTKVSAKAIKFNRNQMQIPGFLGQVANPRLEEMVAERVNQALAKAIEVRVQQVLNNVLPLKKAQ